MGWSLGYDGNWQRDVGYGVPAYCDHPKCKRKINRGLAFVCGGEPYGGESGCGLYFCEKHLHYTTRNDENGEEDSPQLCEICIYNFELDDANWQQFKKCFEPKPDHKQWIRWKLKDASWAEWRENHPTLVEEMKKALAN